MAKIAYVNTCHTRAEMRNGIDNGYAVKLLRKLEGNFHYVTVLGKAASDEDRRLAILPTNLVIVQSFGDNGVLPSETKSLINVIEDKPFILITNSGFAKKDLENLALETGALYCDTNSQQQLNNVLQHVEAGIKVRGR